jgi:hypothetical protein
MEELIASCCDTDRTEDEKKKGTCRHQDDIISLIDTIQTA